MLLRNLKEPQSTPIMFGSMVAMKTKSSIIYATKLLVELIIWLKLYARCLKQVADVLIISGSYQTKPTSQTNP